MIKEFIKSPMSLIIVVRKADDDNENVEALRVASTSSTAARALLAAGALRAAMNALC